MTAHQPHQKFLVLGGFISTARNWASFSDAWQIALDQPPKLEYFKMNEAILLKGQFAPERGWNESLRDDRVITLTRIIKKYAMLRIHASIRTEDFQENIAKLAVPERSLLTDSPFIYIFIKLIIAMAIRSTVYGINEPCDFIFDQQSGHAEEIWRRWPDFVNIIEYSRAERKSKFPLFLCGKPKFEDDKLFKPLQAADLFANQMRFYTERNSGRMIVPPNKILQQLLPITSIEHDSTSDELKRLRQVAIALRDTLLEKNPGAPPLIGLAKTSGERKSNRRRARKAAKKKASVSKDQSS
jgi:hypothetical protein